MSGSKIYFTNPQKTPRSQGYRQPAERTYHECCWLAWPDKPELWGNDLKNTQQQFISLCRAIGNGGDLSERLEILVPDTKQKHLIEQALGPVDVRFHTIPYGDIWLRDTGPIFLTHPAGQIASVCFAFNGWGERYKYAHDDTVASDIARKCGFQQFSYSWVFEGGAVDVDGEGTCLASKNCLLNPNRNPGQEIDQMEERLREALGIEKILWIDGSLVNDHTDGHVDTLVRFVEPGKVVCMTPVKTDDINRKTLEQISGELEKYKDARGRKLIIEQIVSPYPVYDRNHQILPASYLNFYISNSRVIVPVFGSDQDDKAVDQISALFPSHHTIGLRADAILQEGGAFHCITLQQPRIL